MDFTRQEARNLFELFGDEDALITVTEEGGVKTAWFTEYPEEGCTILNEFCQCSKPTTLQAGISKMRCDDCNKPLSVDDQDFQKLEMIKLYGPDSVNTYTVDRKMTFKGFRCKQCNKPFFVVRDTYRDIIDNRREIKKYEEQGFEFTSIPEDVASSLDGWCLGHEKGTE